MIGQIIDSATEPLQKQKAPNSVPALILGGLSLSMVACSFIYSYVGILYSVSVYMRYLKTTALVMIVFAFVFSIASVLLGAIGVVKVRKGYEMYDASPNSYFGVGMLKAGNIMSLIGLILGALCVVLAIISVVVYNTFDYGYDSGYYYY